MKFVSNRHITDPRLNLALEEYLLRELEMETPLLLFYVNEPAVIIGRNQNTIEEIDPDFIKQNDIHVVRRLSGGGAVFHDLGNLNFSFITNDNRDIHNFAKFINPVAAVLKKLGVPAELHGSSDVFVDGKKISGNAQFSARGRLFSHGTILFDTDIETMLRALNPRQIEIESKAVQSVRNFVTNIKEWLPREMTLKDLKQAILDELFGSEPPTLPLSADQWGDIEKLAEERYDTWEWNYGRSPRFNVQKTVALGRVTFNARLWVDKGLIEEVTLYGNFEAKREIKELLDRLIGVRYEPEAIRYALQDVELVPYVGSVSLDEFVTVLY